MELDNLALSWPEDAGIPAAVVDAWPIFSPLPREYDSFLEAMEVEWWEADAHTDAPVVPAENMPMSEREVVNEEAVMEEESNKGGNAQGSKNMLSERNRRKRLNQQLIALRSLVPGVSKMDKRSILMDAATYLQNLHKEIEQIKREIAEQEASQESAPSPESNITSSTPEINAQEEASSDHHHIFKIETDEMDERTLTVKVVFRMARGAPAQVQRMIESLGASVTHTWTHEMEDHQMVTTSFINVKKQMSLTAETLKEHMSKAAIKMGFEIDLDD